MKQILSLVLELVLVVVFGVILAISGSYIAVLGPLVGAGILAVVMGVTRCSLAMTLLAFVSFMYASVRLTIYFDAGFWGMGLVMGYIFVQAVFFLLVYLIVYGLSLARFHSSVTTS